MDECIEGCMEGFMDGWNSSFIVGHHSFVDESAH